MPRLRRGRLLGLLALTLVLAGAAWAGWTAWRVNDSLARAADDASALQDAVTAGDATAVDNRLAALRTHSDEAADRTDTWTWSALTHVPVVGDDAEGIAVVSDVLSDLSADGLEPLADAADRLDALKPQGGRVDTDALVDLREPVGRARAALDAAAARLAELDSDGFVDRLAIRYDDLEDKVVDARDLMSSTSTALDVMPSMLGADGPRNHLMIFQNNAEVRSTGGLPGALSLVRAEGGKVELARQVPGQTIPATSEPIVPLEDGEKAAFPGFGYLALNSNVTPDFPRVAEAIRAHYEASYPESLDGVLAVDPVALGYVLGATGPVQVGDVELSADNVVDELLHQAYLRYEDPRAQDLFFQTAARAIFDRVSSGVGDAETLVRALTRATAEGRILVHSFDGSEQAALDGRPIAGELVTDPNAERPQVGAYFQDSTGGKMSYFLRYGVRATATSCADGVQRITARAVLRSDAPADAASLPDYVTSGGAYGTDPGSQLVAMRILGPVGGEIGAITYDGKPIDNAILGEVYGRPITTVIALLEPGRDGTVEWRMTSGEDQTGDVDVSVTPGIEAKDYGSTARSSCR
ncbi:DUF4012 domain-containing protein [Nocardioides sp. NPDC092400]|uniref:DUF4012 domain-containing protein n=1 Tax=Nocardioides sp. NPDC092400 TaxID=3155196 RepID=UPI00343FCF4B